MKRLMQLATIMLIMLPLMAFANPNANVTFAWDDPNAVGDVIGYRLYESMTAGQHTYGAGNEVLAIPVGTLTGTITVSGGGKRYYVLTVYNTTDESGPSNEVPLTLLASPTGLEITIIIKIN